MLSSPVLGEGLRRYPTCVLTLELKERKTRCAYQVRALSLAPPASRSSRASCAPLAALAAAGALVVAMEAAVAVGRAAPGPRRWRSFSRASAGSTCRTLADAAGSAAQGWLLLLQRAAGGGRTTRVPTRTICQDILLALPSRYLRNPTTSNDLHGYHVESSHHHLLPGYSNSFQQVFQLLYLLFIGYIQHNSQSALCKKLA
ncbi:PREDICTED: uncharacterized protein LOC109375477 [Hipposideros armiger]|uniref:Uncharacterized protein LOC109375477 n=1 Tax=Hipposideros armiger TaxID=186990 RepID=A0A8B7QFI7_HIPAR|nr:PREDICTED: uncharacterized protein LOC109375477 [Hipposideros armiger]